MCWSKSVLMAIGCCLVCAAIPAFAQKEAAAKTLDPFDLSSAREKAGGGRGIPTVALVDELESKAKALVAAGDCKAAVPALELFGRHANTLANLVSAGLQPYYGAGYDERKRVSVGDLVKYESLANDYKQKRNRAIVLQAECAMKLGQKDQAATLFVHALNLLSVDDKEYWSRARTGLYQFIDLK